MARKWLTVAEVSRQAGCDEADARKAVWHSQLTHWRIDRPKPEQAAPGDELGYINADDAQQWAKARNELASAEQAKRDAWCNLDCAARLLECKPIEVLRLALDAELVAYAVPSPDSTQGHPLMRAARGDVFDLATDRVEVLMRSDRTTVHLRNADGDLGLLGKM